MFHQVIVIHYIILTDHITLSLSKLKVVDLNYFLFYFLFNLVSFILFLELGLVLVMVSLGHTSVTSDDMVTVTITSHMIQGKT